MQLSRDRYGRLGRHIRTMGENEHAIVAVSPTAQAQKDVVLSNVSVEQYGNQYAAEDIFAAQRHHFEKMQEKVLHQAEVIEFNRRQAEILKEQTDALPDMNNELLKWYFNNQNGMSETELVNRNLKADYFDLERTPDDQFIQNFSPRADFRQYELTGSPLSDDGSFGPSTDWDRFVRGKKFGYDLIPEDYQDNSPVIVGGTMLGRYDGRSVPYSRTINGRPTRRRAVKTAMGEWYDPTSWFASESTEPVDLDDESFWEPEPTDPIATEPEPTEPEEPSWFSKFWGGVGTGVTAGAQTAAQQVVQHELTSGLIPQPSRTGATAPVPQAVRIAQATNPIQKAAATLNVPTWALYAAIGMTAVGVGVMVLKRRT